VTNLPSQADAIVAAPGVIISGASRTLLAVSTGGVVSFGTLDTTGFVGRGPTAVSIPGTRQLALSAVPDGGAALLVSDGFNITRWDLDVSSGTVVPTQGFTGSASPAPGGDDSLSLAFDGMHDIGFVGGHTIGDIYIFDARLDAGTFAFDLALFSSGRLSPPVSGVAIYGVSVPLYLLAANGQGVTVYTLPGTLPVSVPSVKNGTILDAGFRVIGTDISGSITSPQGVALTNLPAGGPYPSGVVVIGDPATRQLATLSWAEIADAGGLKTIDLTDPRGDGGTGPDAGCPDGGTSCPPPVDGGGGGGNPGGPGVIPGPGIPVDHGTSCACASATDAPALLAMVAVLGLVARRRQRR
jgi:MYXO-CTERM domain-containing protein